MNRQIHGHQIHKWRQNDEAGISFLTAIIEQIRVWDCYRMSEIQKTVSLVFVNSIFSRPCETQTTVGDVPLG